MTRYGSPLDAVSLETGRHVVVAQSGRIEPVFERRARAVCGNMFRVPEPLERRHLAVPSATPGPQRQIESVPTDLRKMS